MNMQEAFSPENTAHLSTKEDRDKYVENMMQLSWLEMHPDMTEAEFFDRSRWFREEFFGTDEYHEFIAGFQEDPEAVKNRLEASYVASVSKH